MPQLRTNKAFTLIELLVVIAIIAILAAILFPVFAQAKEAGKRTVCLSNFAQVSRGFMMYLNDHDDNTPHSNSGSINGPGWGFGRPDYVWGEVVLPYVKNFHVYRCPSDPNATDQGLSKSPYEVPVPPNHPQISYYWLSRSNLGYNYDFLSPWVVSSANNYVGSITINSIMATNPAQTVLFVDSIWYRNTVTGKVEGGGNWVVEAPCVRDSNGLFLSPIDQITVASNPLRWQNYGTGWVVKTAPGPPYSWLEFGGCWPFHTGRMNTMFLDGHIRNQSIGSLTEGCVVRRNFAGPAFDGDKYLWDLR